MRAVADKIGMRIHSVLYGWAEFNSPDKSEVERTFAESQAALRTAEAFGADTVLLVPCRIGSRGGRAGSAGRGPGAAHAARVGVPDRVQPRERPLDESGLRRQRALRRLHQGAQPRDRHVSRVGQAADSAGGEDEGRHRARERQQQPMGHAGDLPAFRPIVPESLGQGVLRHRQSRALRPA